MRNYEKKLDLNGGGLRRNLRGDGVRARDPHENADVLAGLRRDLRHGLEGHLLAGLFRERFGLPIFDYLRRYVVLRQKEGAFRKGDPQIAVMFVTGSILHFAMVRHVFHHRKPYISEEAAVREMVDMALAGLAETRGPRLIKKAKTSTKKAGRP